jgi:hypothetical protein
MKTKKLKFIPREVFMADPRRASLPMYCRCKTVSQKGKDPDVVLRRAKRGERARFATMQPIASGAYGIVCRIVGMSAWEKKLLGTLKNR